MSHKSVVFVALGVQDRDVSLRYSGTNFNKSPKSPNTPLQGLVWWRLH